MGDETKKYFKREGTIELVSEILGRVKSYGEDSRWGRYFLFVSIFLVFFFMNHQYVSQNLNLPQWVVVEINTDESIQMQVYYDIGDGYGEKDKRIQLVPGNKDFQRIKIKLPSKPLRFFRIDPLTEPGVVYIKSIAIESLLGRSHSWPADQIAKDFRPQNDIGQFQLENDVVKVRSVGIDPYFGCIVPIPRINRIGDGWIILILFVFSLVCLLFYRIVVLIKERWETMDHRSYLLAVKMSFILIGVLLPFFLALHFIRGDSINIPFWDQWEFVPLLSAFFEGKPWIHLLINFHNEHRIIFPRVLFLFLAVITKWDVVIENYVNLFFIGIILIAIWKLLKETGGPLILMVPISWLLFSLQQWEDLLWGWQIQVTMMLSAAIITIFCLNRVNRIGYYVIPALISGALASFSFMGGLCIWPIGLLQMLMIRAKKSVFFTWFIGGTLTIWLYFMGYRKPTDTPDVFIFLRNPVDFIKYILAYVGSGLSGNSIEQSFVYGIIVIILFISTVLFQRLKMKRWGKIVPWVMMALFSLLCGGMIGIGRLGYGIDQALSSRYICISSIFIISTMVLTTISIVDFNIRKEHDLFKNSILITLLVTTMILFSGFVDSYISGWREGYYQKLIRGQFSRSLYDMKKANEDELKMIYWDVKVLKDRAAILQKLKIGPYATTTK